jgi:hypothetical protein
MNASDNQPTSQIARKSRLILTFLAVTTLGVVLFGFNSMHSHTDWPGQFRSNGEKIYFMGANAPGVSSGSNRNNTMMGMMGGGCANCHGADRQGARLMPQFWLMAPPLTPDALFTEPEESHQDDGHGEHDKYTDKTIRQAITGGLDPAGEPLNAAMPR